MMNLKSIGRELLFFFAIAAFIIIVTILGLGATFFIAFIGKWIGIGYKVFIYVTLFVATWKAWDLIAWIVGKIAEREETNKCSDCEYWGSMSCPNSNECYTLPDKPHFKKKSRHQEKI